MNKIIWNLHMIKYFKVINKLIGKQKLSISLFLSLSMKYSKLPKKHYFPLTSDVIYWKYYSSETEI